MSELVKPFFKKTDTKENKKIWKNKKLGSNKKLGLEWTMNG